jgi:membrane-bound lytic murein transglycosylase D
MIFRNKLLILLLLINPLIIKGFTAEKDSSDAENMIDADTDSTWIDDIQSGFVSNLDSLLNLWFVGNSLDNDYQSEDYLMADTIFPVFSDSVYIDRLGRIPALIDLSYNRHVRSFIELYTTRRRELVGILLGLSEYYFPIFEEVFAFYDIPLELKYCSIVESALNPRAVSRAGATGIWQFMYGTGRMYGLTINSLVDERRDPFKSTHAAAQFMQDLYRIYGDWLLVIAAYNCGPTNVNKAIRRSGGKKDFWDIYYYLPRETRGHVPAFIAAAYFMNYYHEHNLLPRKIEFPLPVDTIMITEELHLEQIARVMNIPLQMLRDLNPQYKYDIIPGHEKPYSLRLPLEFSTKFIELSDTIFTYMDSVYFNKEKKIKTPSYHSSQNFLPGPPSPDMAKIYYTVKTGDNLGYIASWYNVGVSNLRYWNNVRGTMIRSGQKLIVYIPKNKLSHYQTINTMSFEEKQKMIGKEVLVADDVNDKTQTSLYSDDYIYYIVKSGDTLWEIAKKFHGVTDTDLMQMNGISDASKIKPGQVLKVKKKG